MDEKDYWQGRMDQSDPPVTLHFEGHVRAEGMDDPLFHPDADGHDIVSNIGLRVNDVGPYVPVRVEVYRLADTDTILALLDKVRAGVERLRGGTP
jgi:hypothetical protein